MTTQPKRNVHKISHTFRNLINSFHHKHQNPTNNPQINPELVMCKTKTSLDVIPPQQTPSSRHHHNHRKQPTPSTTSTSFETPLSKPHTTTTTSTSSSSSRHSLSSIRGSLPENPHLYNISEIRTATNNFLAKPFSKTCWRCELHGKPVLIFQRKSHHPRALNPPTLRQKLFSICKSHHVAIINLLGASISGDYIYLVYDFISGTNLADLLRSKNNPNFTVLNTWMSRMQVATDIANGLDYIHNNTSLDVTFVHNHIKSSSVIVTEPSFNAKICHFGTAVLCGEPTEERENVGGFKVDEIVVEDDGNGGSLPKKLTRSNSVQFNGTTGYMSPEFQLTGVGTRKSDVYAFGVVLVELLSGQEVVKYKYNKAKREYVKISAVDAAREVVADNEGGREGRLRKWVDSRLKDSYPVEVADKLTRIAVECLHVDPDRRPDMRRVAGKISKLYLDSQAWCDNLKIPTEITVSFAAR